MSYFKLFIPTSSRKANKFSTCVHGAAMGVFLCVMAGVSFVESLVCLSMGQASGSVFSVGLCRGGSPCCMYMSVFWRMPRVTVQFCHQFPGGAHLDLPMKKPTVSAYSHSLNPLVVLKHKNP